MDEISLNSDYKRIVVKVGTSSLTHSNGEINLHFINKLCEILTDIHNSGREVVLVTSGAIGVGKRRVNLKNKKLSLSEKQAMAAIGQGLLLHIYEKGFSEFGQVSAQLLLTRDDLRSRKRFLNIRNTILELLHLNVIPIINENDSVANEEIKFGDNDNLASLVAILCDADLVILLTDIDGLYTANPTIEKNAKKLEYIQEITSEIEKMAGDALSNVGTGGMRTKLEAAKIATNAGVKLVIASGKEPKILYEILNGAKQGTMFDTTHPQVKSRKSWIMYGSQAEGSLVVDDGAYQALKVHGRSLLPSGILSVEGHFEKGAIVNIADKNRSIFAKGICNYSSDFLTQIKGKRTQELANIFKDFTEDEVVHRDNLGIL